MVKEKGRGLMEAIYKRLRRIFILVKLELTARGFGHDLKAQRIFEKQTSERSETSETSDSSVPHVL